MRVFEGGSVGQCAAGWQKYVSLARPMNVSGLSDAMELELRDLSRPSTSGVSCARWGLCRPRDANDVRSEKTPGCMYVMEL